MFSISNSIVRVNRGDSFELNVPLNTGSVFSPYTHTLSETDAVYVGIMEPNQRFEDALIKKKLTTEDQVEDHVVVRFWPEDTIKLMPGKYYYQVKLETTDSTTQRKHVATIVDKTLFFLEE